MNKSDFKIGMEVFLKPVNNAARYGTKKILRNTITKIGRKYFTIGNDRRPLQFEIDNLCQKTEYSPDYELYFSEQEILDETEANSIFDSLRVEFTKYGKTAIPLEKLRQIKQILEEK